MAAKKKILLLTPIILIFGAIAFFAPSFFLGSKLSIDESEAGQGIDWAKASPDTIFVNQPTTITITTQIKLDPTLIRTSVTLIRYDSVGKSLGNLGTLYDDGTHGDTTPGDNIFSGQITFNETTTGTIYLKTSVAYKGVLKRTLSTTFNIQIKENYAFREPAQLVSGLQRAVQSNNIDEILNCFDEGVQDKYRAVFEANRDKLSQLSQQLKTLEAVKIGDKISVYKFKFIDTDGSLLTDQVFMRKGMDGIWRIYDF